MKTDLFSGYVRLTAREYDGLVLLDRGHVLNAIEEVKAGAALASRRWTGCSPRVGSATA